ncbi:MAG: hypothetical protein NUV87_02420 [Candidatus Roizmanbacteria bacterium]|nr:hypothetical protein [Candidatus Roizmanbacteria bacterium]MCR4312724.1 hypothetical protein [Candidatus Roizmanbacteria bacterium]
MVLPNGEGGATKPPLKFEFGRGPEIYKFTCNNCGRSFSVDGENMPKDWKKSNIVTINCTNCSKPNRINVASIQPLAYR